MGLRPTAATRALSGPPRRCEGPRRRASAVARWRRPTRRWRLAITSLDRGRRHRDTSGDDVDIRWEKQVQPSLSFSVKSAGVQRVAPSKSSRSASGGYVAPPWCPFLRLFSKAPAAPSPDLVHALSMPGASAFRAYVMLSIHTAQPGGRPPVSPAPPRARRFGAGGMRATRSPITSRASARSQCERRRALATGVCSRRRLRV